MNKVFWIFLFPILFFSKVCFANDTIIISGHPEYPPITWQEGNKIVGVAIELVQTIFTELNVPYKVVPTGPWARVQMNAEKGRIDVITSLYINPDRQSYMHFCEFFMIDPVSIFVLKGKTFPFKKWEDLIGKKGNTVRGESYGKNFDSFIIERLEIERVTTVAQNFFKLEKERIDYAIIGLYPGLSNASIIGFKEKIEVLPQNITEENLYMAFSKKSKHIKLIPQVNEIIIRLKKEGLIDKWIEKYLKYYEDTRGASASKRVSD